MDLLPEECIDIIVSYLDVVSLTWLGLSSKRLRDSCFSPRYWTHVDLSTVYNDNIASSSIVKLSRFATSLQILNIQNCKHVSLQSLVPFVFEFKELELIKHDEEHRLLDETVAVNRMLNKADQLVEKYKYNEVHQLSEEESRSKFDNAVRQARALIWDALLVVVANKRGSTLPNEKYFQNIHHPQGTLDHVMKKLRAAEKMLVQPLKLWHNTLAWTTAIEGVSFVTDPRTDKIYLACGVSGEIVLWDMDTRTVFKVFNYLDSLDQVTAKNAKRVRDFIGVFVFSHLDRLMIFGGTSRGGVCWDFDTKQVVYEMHMPYEESSDGDRSRYYARSWGLTNNQEGFVEVYGGAFLFDLGTGQLGPILQVPSERKASYGQLVYSRKSGNLVLTASKKKTDYIVTIVDLLTQQEKQILTLLPSSEEVNYGDATVDWYNDQLIAVRTSRGIEIYKDRSDTGSYQFELHVIIDYPNQVSSVKLLSEKLLLVDDDIFDVDTGKLEIQLESGPRGNLTVCSPDLNVVVQVDNIGVVAIYDMKTKQKIGPAPCVSPLSAFSKLDNETILLHGNYSTLGSYINYHGRNYAKVSLNGCKLIETLETPMQILDVSYDGKYVLAQDNRTVWKSRHNVNFVVFEMETKRVIFQRDFLQGHKSATWSVSAVGQFMPQHSDQVLLSHPKSGFQIIDVTSGKLLRDYSADTYGGVGNHIKISADERFVAFKTVKSNMGSTEVVDLLNDKSYNIRAHSNAADSIAFNPTNSCQFVIAGYGISVFNLPNTQREFFFTRHLDGLVEPIRESEEVVCLKFSPDGRYLAAIDPPSRGPWGLEIANTLIRVYETTTFTQVSSFDTGGHARALYWLDNERALVGMINGELMTLQLVVEEIFLLTGLCSSFRESAFPSTLLTFMSNFKNRTPQMDLLPEECVDIIVSYLDIVSLTWLGLSSKRLRDSCFSPRYWTHIDLSNTIARNNGNNVTNESIVKLSRFATSLQILNIQNCPRVNLESLVPLVFSFKELEVIKHDGEHRLLDETVAVNRMLNKADQLIRKYKIDDETQENGEERRQKYDNAVRQSRALIWDAMLIVVANKRGKHLPKECYFKNIHHPQNTLDHVMQKLRDTEKMLGQPLKLWHNTLTWKTVIKSVTFVTDPRTDKIYLACGVSGEIVLWDMDTRTVFKVFNYLDSLDQVTAKNAKRVRDFIGVFVFSHLDRLMIFGGTSQGGVCWDFDTSQIVYEMKLPREDSEGGDRGRYYAKKWAINKKKKGIIEVYGAMFMFDAVTGQLGPLKKIPKDDPPKIRAYKTIVHSSKHNSLVLKSWKENEEDFIVSVIDLETQQEKQILKLVPSPHKGDFGDTTMDWYNEQLIAVQANRGIEIYQNQSDTDHQYELHLIIDRPKKVSKVKFLSEKLLLIDYDIFEVDTGKIEIHLDIPVRNNLIIYNPELNIIVHAHDVGIATIYDMKTKQKIGPDPCVTPLCAFSKLDSETVLLHGNFSTLGSYVNYHGSNYAKVSLNGCKLIETVETPMQILDVSSDGMYALAQAGRTGWKSRHDVKFLVLELETKQVIFQRNFLQDHDSASWSIYAVGRFMPQHSDQVLLSHPKAGFQIFDVSSGKLLRDYSSNDYGEVGSHIKISLDERFVAFKSVKYNLGCAMVVDLEQNKAYDIRAHSNSSDSIAFNPTNSRQFVIAGYGISVFNLPNTQREFFFTRHLDGLVEPIRESEEVVCLKFSPDGRYLAAIDPPSRGPWGLEIANTLIRVYETTTFTQVSSFDTGGHARALYWLDNERALVGMINGELMTLQLVVEEYKSLFDYVVPSRIPKKD